MSYVSEQRRSNPIGMGAAIAVNGSIILAVALSPLVVEPAPPGKRLQGEAITLAPPPPPPDIDKPQTEPKTPPIFAPKRMVETLTPPKPGPTTGEVEATGFPTGGGTLGDEAGRGPGEVPTPPTPVFSAATRDPKFARSFQPEYPVGKLRLEIEGSVTVRVLIGTDGRVRQVQIVRATDAEFAKAAERQALRAWRFKPATRDGVPVEDWQTLTVRFDIN
jgi:periplasmic protein TonB